MAMLDLGVTQLVSSLVMFSTNCWQRYLAGKMKLLQLKTLGGNTVGIVREGCCFSRLRSICTHGPLVFGNEVLGQDPRLQLLIRLHQALHCTRHRT